ncbi:TRAF-like family protein [Raphanus sativus]|nr:TRAF-like family protein [Raphanus sativus]
MVPLTNWEVVSFTQKPSNPKFSWTVNKFSKLKEHRYVSDKFLMGGKNWALSLYPKGVITSDCKSISIYLKLADKETLKEGEQIYTKADLRTIDPFGCNHKKRQINSGQERSHLLKGLGWVEFVFMAELEKAYLDKEGSLKLEIEFEAIFATTYSP